MKEQADARPIPKIQRRVLLVEDEASLRRALATYLRTVGHVVTEAANGEEAVRIVGQVEKPFEVLITDMVMPKMNGGAVAAAVQEHSPNLKVIYMSGYTEDDPYRPAISNDRRSEFIHKPFKMNMLSSLIDKLFDVHPDF